MESGDPGSGQWVGIKDLRDGLSRYLDRVRDGGTITVTDHGRPIARITPVGRLTTYEQMLQDGRITPGRRPKGPAPEPIELAGGGTVSEFIAEQRGPIDDLDDEPRL
jgi:prevent-host-death family protein